MSSTAAEESIAAPAPDLRPRRPVNLRSLAIGLIGVLYLSSLTAFNDNAVGNTQLVGNYLPVGVLLFLTVLLLAVNAPLRRLRPRLALSQGELAVALGMMLVACAVPGSGLMRYLFPSLNGLYSVAGEQFSRAEVLGRVQLPDWLLPGFGVESDDVSRRAASPVVGYFQQRVPGVGDGLWAKLSAVPWSAWLLPAVTWGLLVALLFGATLCGAIIVRRQWVENERLAFPLAGVWLSLIEEPKAGRLLNATLGSRGFWLAALAVFALHSWNALGLYRPQEFPRLPLGFDFRGSLLSQPPLSWVHWATKHADVYFVMIGIAFFIQLKVGFSLWAIYLIMSAARVGIAGYGAQMTAQMEEDQSVGAFCAFAVAILWVGRRHWALVGRQMFRGRREGEPAGRYMPYAAAGWGLVACAGGLVILLTIAGMSPLPAAVVVLGTLLLFLVVARVVAETGLIFAQLRVPVSQAFLYAALTPLGKVRGFDYFVAQWFHVPFGHDLRENLAPYATHALRVADGAAYSREHGPSAWRRTLPFVVSLVLALGVAYVASTAATLTVHYNYAARLDKQAATPLDNHAQAGVPRNTIDNVRDWTATEAVKDQGYSRGGHFAFGAGVTAALAFLRLRFEAWPLHPIGFLLVYTYPIHKIWFSLMLGWFAKALIVKFGGPPLMRSARPVFLGLIFGETAAAAFWLTASLARVSLGLPYEAVNLLPT